MKVPTNMTNTNMDVTLNPAAVLAYGKMWNSSRYNVSYSPKGVFQMTVRPLGADGCLIHER